jgi:inhibitor of cysteine peptidase
VCGVCGVSVGVLHLALFLRRPAWLTENRGRRWDMATVEVRASGSTVQVAVGDEIVVRVPEIPTTGYTWTMSDVDEKLQVMADSYVSGGGVGAGADAGGHPAPGAAGHRMVRLLALSPGAAEVRLSLKRPWESSATEVFAFTASIAG